MWYTLGKSSLVVAALLVAGWFVPFSRQARTCVICRLTKVQSTYGPLPSTRHYENDCSRWYAANVEPQHDHVWERNTCTFESNLYGTWRGFGCSPGRYPIWMLSPDTQMRAYQHFKDPLEAKDLFAGLTDAKTHGDRLDEDDDDKGHLIVRALTEWDIAGFPGTWQGWWSRYYARHVEERKEWRAWIESDSGLHFDDWRKRRATDRTGPNLVPDVQPD